MNKRMKAISIFVGVLLPVFLLTAVVSNMKNKKIPETASVQEEKRTEVKIDYARDLIAQGAKYEREGKYVEARAAYQMAINEATDNDTIEKAEKGLYALNMKILFSPIITEDSQIYTVVKGDSLSKIAKRYDTTVELLKKSNQLGTDRIKVGMELKVSTAKYGIVVDKSQNVLILKFNGEVLRTYKVSTGTDDATPIGSFEVINKLPKPTWYSTGAVVSPDSPENILGSRWIGISRAGYGIHGTTEPDTIGKHVTAGCVRMHNSDVEELYSIIPIGTEVTIVN